MKNIKLFFSIFFLTFALSISAQNVPQKFKYQGVAKIDGQTVVGGIGIQITIRSGSPDGQIIFQERHFPTTNMEGVFATEIGSGTLTQGAFQNIDWASGVYFMQVQLDPNGGANYADLGVSQLVSVPYALHAATVDNADDADADPENELQFLEYDQTTGELTISEGNTIALPTGGGSLQDLSLNGTQLGITGGNAVDLSPLQDGTEDADADPENELQTLSFDGNTNELTISEGNSVVLPSDGSDNQVLSLNGTNLSIEDGNTVDLSFVQDGTIDDDADPQNELQHFQVDELMDVIGEPPYPEAIDIILSETNDTARIYDPNPINELQDLELVEIFPSPYSDDGWQKFKLTKSEVELVVDDNPANEIQTLQLESFPYTPSGEKLRLNIVAPNGLAQAVEWENDNDPVNEIQQLQKDGNVIKLFNNMLLPVSQVILNDDDPANELQNWENLPGIPDGFKDGIDNVNDADSDPTNELQSWLTLPLIPSGFSDGVDDEGPWEENPSTQTVSYEGKAVTDSYCTTSGSVVMDETGISRYQPSSGKNVSNICLEEYGSSVTGKIEILKDEDLALEMLACTHGSGIWNALGPNGNSNTYMAHLDNFPNNGLMGVVDASNNLRAGSYISNSGQGVVFGDVKNFRMEHPKNPSKEIWYASLEGPEAGAYERGTATLEDGTVFVPFSDHFKEVANPESMTVMLTPLSADTYGLAVVNKTATGFTVRELAKGKGNFDFDWEVKCVRKGFEDYEVVRDRMELMHRDH